MRRFSVGQLEALLAIAQLGSFQAAARHINVTQPTISLRMRELEQALGTALFARAGRGVALTAEGALAVRCAEQALGLFDELETRLRTGDPLQGLVRLGCSSTLAMTCLPEVICRLKEQYPNVRVEMTVTDSFVLCDKLNANELDFALLTDPGVNRHISLELLAYAPVAIVGGGSARVAFSSEGLRPADLVNMTLLSISPPSPLNELFLSWLETEDLPRIKLHTCNNMAVITNLACAGIGLSLLPACSVRQELDSGAPISYPLRSAIAPLRICAAYPRASEVYGLRAVVDIARQVMRETGHFVVVEEPEPGAPPPP